MIKKKNIYFFIGVTGELIKLAPIIKEFQKRKIPFKIITSGQGRIYYEELNGYIGTLRTDISFPEKAHRSSIFYFLLWAIRTLLIAPFLLRKEFSGLDKAKTYFIIQGDPISSSIGAVIAKLFGIKLVHVESGDLSGNLLEPFPEEICRHINIRLADILFPPNDWALRNLKRIKMPKIDTIHNSLIECFMWAIKKPDLPKAIQGLKKYYFLFMHRQEHVIFRKNFAKSMLEFVIRNANPSLKCVLLNNHLTTSIINSLGSDWDEEFKKKLIILPRLPYTDFMKLLNNAEFLATDSATNQLEAYFMGKPFLALRNLTEQIEGIGKNVVIGRENKKIIKNFLRNYKKYETKPITLKKSPSKIIVDYLMKN